jgi:predicted TIM-barrel fold metal-dependent hydrolase
VPRYSGPIIDAHHHFWQPAMGRNPWLFPDAAIPFRYGNYDAIKREYLPPDLLEDATGFNIVGTVSMETEWDLDDPIGEIRHLEDIRNRWGLPDAAVAHAVLQDSGVEGVLAEYRASHPLVVAIRDKPGQASSPAKARRQPSLMTDPNWIQGYSLLSHYGLTFELQTAWWHLSEAVELGRRFPEISTVVNHAGLPSDRSDEALAGWAKALRQIAELPNVTIKISGIGLEGIPWTVEINRQIVETVAEIFGIDRIMFGSNFPVDSLTGSFHDIFGGYLEITSSWSSDEQAAAFIKNAIKIYRLNPEVLERTRPDPRATESSLPYKTA